MNKNEVKKKYTISAFFPVYNDWGTIASMVISVNTVLERIATDYEILLIDDGSKERTKRILKELSHKINKVRVITHPKNKGYGGALKTGIYSSKFELIFYTDGDAQYNPEELELLINNFGSDIDIVNGYKISRSDPVYRKVIGRIYHYITKLLFRFKIRDIDCDFRLMRKRMFENLILENDSGVICVEMITKITRKGYKFEEVPVHHYYRISGKSQFFNFRRIFRVIMDLLKLWYKLHKKEMIR